MRLRTTVLSLLAASVSLSAALAALLSHQATPHVLTQSADDADHVWLYENGLAAVTLERHIVTDGSPTPVRFALPITTIFESIRLDGDVTVRELRSSLADEPFARPGDDVVVHLDGASFKGTLLAADGGSLSLRLENSTIQVAAAKVTALEVLGRAARAGPGTTQVDVLLDAAAGNHTVRLSYLVSGPGWTPSYHLDLHTGALAFLATVSNTPDWKDVQLDLMSGSPRVQATGVSTWNGGVAARTFELDSFAAGDGKDTAPTFAASTQLGDLHDYHYSGTVTFHRGETVRLQVLQGDIDIARHYFLLSFSGAAEHTEADETYELHNTLSEPLPSGIVRVYEGSTWVGEDTLQDLARGAMGNITVSRSGEVFGRSDLVSGGGTCCNGPYTYRLRAENHEDHPVDVRVAYNGYRMRLTESSLRPQESTTARAAWDAVLAPGATTEYVFTYNTDP